MTSQGSFAYQARPKWTTFRGHQSNAPMTTLECGWFGKSMANLSMPIWIVVFFEGCNNNISDRSCLGVGTQEPQRKYSTKDCNVEDATMLACTKTKAFPRWNAGMINKLDAISMTKVHVDLRKRPWRSRTHCATSTIARLNLYPSRRRIHCTYSWLHNEEAKWIVGDLETLLVPQLHAILTENVHMTVWR